MTATNFRWGITLLTVLLGFCLAAPAARAEWDLGGLSDEQYVSDYFGTTLLLVTKTQLVAAVAEAMSSDKKTAGAALDAIASVVSREVAAGGSVTIPGLGKVACKARPERMVRNPATGEQMKKPADRQVKFAIAKALKDVVNG